MKKKSNLKIFGFFFYELYKRFFPAVQIEIVRIPL